MDLLPRIGGVDPYQGGAQQRPGTGAFPRKKRQDGERDGQGGTPDEASTPPELGVDPLLAEIDRLRALDPDLTESGAHRALKAVRAYLRPADPLDALTQQPVDEAGAPGAETPPGPATGSDVQPP